MSNKVFWISYFLFMIPFMWWGNQRIINRLYIDALRNKQNDR